MYSACYYQLLMRQCSYSLALMCVPDLGGRLRAARRAAKVSAKDVATAVGRDQQSVYRWERGKSRPSFDDLCAYCRCCGTTLSKLFAD